MKIWIFQGNPIRFDVDSYLLDNKEITWSMRQKYLVSDVQIGDEVFIWRSDGDEKGSGGIVARAKILSLPQVYVNDEDSSKYWYEDVKEPYLAIELVVLEVEVENPLKRLDLLQHELLHDLPTLKIKNNTNYLLDEQLGEVLLEEWNRHIQLSQSNKSTVLSIPAASTIDIIERYEIHAFPNPRSYNFSNLVTFRKKGGAMRALYKVVDTFIMDVRKGVVESKIEQFSNDVQNRIRKYVYERSNDFGFERSEYQFWILQFEKSLPHEPRSIQTYSSHVYYMYEDLVSGEKNVRISSNQITNSEEDHIVNFDKVIFEIEIAPIQETEKEQVIKSRIGQSSFKKALLAREKKCKLCGVVDEAFLIASHIKPWSVSNNEERLDVNNGLLLCPNHDALFDKGFISFLENGETVVSDRLDMNTMQFMNVQSTMKVNLSEGQREYMKWHYVHIFNES